MGVDYTKRAAESIAVDVPVAADKLAGAFPTAGTATGSPSGLTIGTGTPLAEGVRFSVSGGTSGTNYTGTATITLSDGRAVVELFQVAVLDSDLDADPTVVINSYPPTVCYTNRDSAVDLLGEFGVTLRLDDDGNGGVNPRERKTIARGAYVASAKVKMYCMGYREEDLQQSWALWHYATVWYARWLCLREGNPNPAGIWELYQEAMADLKDIKSGNLFLTEIPVQLDPAPSFTNVRLDPLYAEKQLRSQQRISDPSYTRFRRFRETFDLFNDEPSY